jgi:hypothetical protein
VALARRSWWIAVCILASLPLSARSEAARELAWARIVATGDPAPGGDPSDVFLSLGGPGPQADGSVYFTGEHALGDFALFRWTPAGAIERVYPVALPSPLPGSAPPASISPFPEWRADVSDDGTLVIADEGGLDGCPGWGGGVLLSSVGAAPFSVALQPGEPLAWFAPGWHTIGSFDETVPSLVAAGNLGATVAAIEAAPCDSTAEARSTRVAIASDATGVLHVLAASGDPAPGIPDAFFGVRFRVEAYADEQRLVQALVRLGPSGPFVDAFYRWTLEDGLEFLVREGQPAPGGGTILYPDVMGLRSDGSLLFVDEQTGGANGVYLARAGGLLEAMHRIGDAAPGAPGGATFTRFSSVHDRGRPGEIAIEVELSTTGTRTSLWSTDGGDALRLHAIESEGEEHRLLEFGLDGRLLYQGRASDGVGSSLWLGDATAPAIEYSLDDVPEGPQNQFPSADIPWIHADPGLRTIAVAQSNFRDAEIYVATLPEPVATALAGIAALSLAAIVRWRRCR